MSGARFVYRVVGLVWVVFGVLMLLVALGYLLGVSALMVFDQLAMPSEVTFFRRVYETSRWLQFAAVFGFGAFCFWFGSSLSGLKSWSRTVGVAVHITMAACLAALSLMVWLVFRSSQSQTLHVTGRLLAASGGVASLVLFALGYYFSTRRAMDAFFGAPEAVKPIRAQCPTCGGALDTERAMCPVCDAVAPPPSPLRAWLVDQRSMTRYTVSTRKLTRIGRDNPQFEIQVDEPTVSYRHAQIEYLEGHFYLHVLKATNRTFVNESDKWVRDVEICDGDVIGLGNARFKFVVE